MTATPHHVNINTPQNKTKIPGKDQNERRVQKQILVEPSKIGSKNGKTQLETQLPEGVLRFTPVYKRNLIRF
ncbi:MAG: hypothetical protein CL912_09035 [Deltaproteobacteria bacterium]|nr:hypothetical protein [Deltaproteobacteria bacterium]